MNRCEAPHGSNPPIALGELRLCTSHYDRLTDALTGLPATTAPALDATWGVRAWGSIAAHPTREAADHALNVATVRYWTLLHADRLPPGYLPPALAVSDGTDWCAPNDYRPGGLTRDWAALELREKTIRTGEPAPLAHGHAEASLPIDSGVADIRLRITHALGYWVRIHVDRQRLTQPTLPTVYRACRWLAGRIDWSAKQDFAGEYADNILELRNRARRTIDLPQPRRVDVDNCDMYVDGVRCTGTLFTIARDTNDPTPLVIQCNTCTAAYDSTQWERLGKRLRRARKPAA